MPARPFVRALDTLRQVRDCSALGPQPGRSPWGCLRPALTPRRSLHLEALSSQGVANARASERAGSGHPREWSRPVTGALRWHWGCAERTHNRAKWR